MGFQPFGYRFEIFASLPPAEARAAIRSKMTGIFDAKNGARGWIAGPFICLWFSAFDRYGPMLFGLISANNFGTRVHGRAGSDLNGVLMFTLLIPLMAWLLFKMVSEGQASGGQLLVIALVFLVGGPLIYWSAHKERKDAEPLERFLRKALAQPDARSKSTVSARKIQEGLRLNLNGEYLEGPVTDAAIQSALMRVGNRDFMIIESAPQDYLQTACRDGRYILEVRKGGPGEHYQAVRNGGAVGGAAKANDTLTYEEVSAAMASYALGDSLPSLLRLQPMVSGQ
ncbi:MAG: hypothetical protein MT490_12600 [Sphingomonas sp.]|uniref:hypothetical protein n=1 Tax=Sphingomonas sp. TaxID=28214 RepID=UPI0022743CD3|nr:hypothetical protein [Sphingomonas sp.]MCX8476630.1 hypothetical protein [Sphingomonas sp.]